MITHVIFAPPRVRRARSRLPANQAPRPLPPSGESCCTTWAASPARRPSASQRTSPRTTAALACWWCAETTAITFQAPDDHNIYNLVSQALFGDGAAAMVVGADPVQDVERPVFEIASAAQTLLPESEGTIKGHLRDVGLDLHLRRDVPKLIAENIEETLVKAFEPLGISDWNSLFWIAHPGGPAILDQIESTLGLKPEKLRATRSVLRDYGNMSSATVIFIMDEMRKQSAKEERESSGEGLEWGVLYGFGPGLTVESVVLHSVPL
ncbi:unnamed protein product [Musa acuminata subsp. burmannicoides]